MKDHPVQCRAERGATTGPTSAASEKAGVTFENETDTVGTFQLMKCCGLLLATSCETLCLCCSIPVRHFRRADQGPTLFRRKGMRYVLHTGQQCWIHISLGFATTQGSVYIVNDPILSPPMLLNLVLGRVGTSPWVDSSRKCRAVAAIKASPIIIITASRLLPFVIMSSK